MDDLPPGRVGFGNGIVIIAPPGDTITVINASNPAAPSVSHQFDLHEFLGWHPLDTIEFYDVRVRGDRAFLLATGGSDAHGDFGHLHVLSLGPAGVLPVGIASIGSDANFQNLFLIDDIAVCTRGPDRRDTVYFDIGDPSNPDFFAWGLTWNCGFHGVPAAFQGRGSIYVPVGSALHRVDLWKDLCGVGVGRNFGPGAIAHAGGAAYFVDELRVWRAEGDAISLVSDVPVGDRAIALSGQFIYTADEVGVYALSAQCAGTLEWEQPVPGLFGSPERWNPRAIISADSEVGFSQAGEYRVTLDEHTEVARAQVRDGDVTLDLATFSLEVGEQLDVSGGTLIVLGAPAPSGQPRAFLKVNAFNGSAGDLPDPEHFDIHLGTGGRLAPGAFPDFRIGLSSRVAMDPEQAHGALSAATIPTIQAGKVIILAGDRAATVAGARPGRLHVTLGAVEGGLTVGGDLSVGPRSEGQAGYLAVTGDLTIVDSALTEITVSGKADQPMIGVAGQATIDGSLRISRAAGYVAKPGDYIPVLTTTQLITPSPAGFASIEGILDTGDPEVFWGLDINTHTEGEHSVALVALRVPQLVLRGGARSPYRATSARNIILVSHGTADSLDSGGPLATVCVSLAGLAARYGLTDSFDVVALNWEEFATNAVDNFGTELIPEAWEGFAGVLRQRTDSRDRLFNPYETARFARSYARSVLTYLATEGVPGGADTGPAKSRIDVGGMHSIQTIGHSSGAYVADAFLSVLRAADESAFKGASPGVRHLTVLDAYLPPQTGGWLPWTGPSLGRLGGHATSAEHYFINDPTPGTNNELSVRMLPGVISMDLGGYPLHPLNILGHGLPIEFYADSITLLRDGATFLVPPARGLDHREVLSRFGAVFSPLAVAAGVGRDVHSALSDIDADEYDDGDIDVARSREIRVLGWTFSMESDAINTHGTDVRRLDSGGFTMRTRSPAIASVIDTVPRPFNAIELDVRGQGGGDGTLAVSLGDRVLGRVRISDLGPAGESVVIGPFPAGIVPSGISEVTLRLDPLEQSPAAVDVLAIRAVTVIAAAESNSQGASDALSAASGSKSQLVATYIGASGKVQVTSLDPATGAWNDQQIDLPESIEVEPQAALAYHDKAGDLLQIAVLSSRATFVFSHPLHEPPRNLTEELLDSGATPIVSGSTTFTSLDGIVFLAGLDAQGRLVLYWQTGQRDAQGHQLWGFTDLDRDHLAPQGLTRPEWFGETVSFVTSWNGLNIVGLDASGELWSVWWAPGMSMWRTDNLTAITGAPPLVGGLSAYVTSWGAINIVGVDLTGNVQIVWWVPEFGADWAKHDLTAMLAHSGFSAQGLATYVTPWGGTNIAGIDQAGDLVVLWWAPGMSQWAVSPLSALIPSAVLPLRSIDGVASPSGLISLFGFTDGTTPVRYYWQPGGEWAVELLP